jgi:hypothetical protein
MSTIEALQPFVCGGLSACFASAIIHPIDLGTTYEINYCIKVSVLIFDHAIHSKGENAAVGSGQ